MRRWTSASLAGADIDYNDTDDNDNDDGAAQPSTTANFFPQKFFWPIGLRTDFPRDLLLVLKHK